MQSHIWLHSSYNPKYIRHLQIFKTVHWTAFNQQKVVSSFLSSSYGVNSNHQAIWTIANLINESFFEKKKIFKVSNQPSVCVLRQVQLTRQHHKSYLYACHCIQQSAGFDRTSSTPVKEAVSRIILVRLSLHSTISQLWSYVVNSG
jgi:hypothetical protein